MTRDAEMPARDYVGLVTRGIGGESRHRPAAVPSAAGTHRLRQLRRPAVARRRVCGCCRRGGVPQHRRGRTRQRPPARLGARTRDDGDATEHVDLLRGLLVRQRTVEGLRVDVDLRWALLHRLVVVGRAADTEIEAELERDRTATGERHAAMVGRASDTAAAKADAWAAVVERDELPNALQRSTIVGFQQADQRELLVPYVDRYFDAIADVWETRTPEMAQDLVVGLFPALVIEQGTVDRTDTWLRTADPDPTLRRLAVEGRDTMARALRARACDASAAD